MCLFSPIYLFICHLCQHGLMVIYLYFGYNSILLYFDALIVLASVIGSSFSWLLCPFNIPVSLWVFGFFFLSASLLSGPTGCSRSILYAPFLESTISLRGTGFFCWESGIRKQDLALMCFPFSPSFSVLATMVLEYSGDVNNNSLFQIVMLSWIALPAWPHYVLIAKGNG